MSALASTLVRTRGMTARHMARGFTLIELMIVVTLLAVMLGIAAPSFRDFMAGQRVKTAAGEYAFGAGDNLVIGQHHAARFHGNHWRVITNARAQRAGGFL